MNDRNRKSQLRIATEGTLRDHFVGALNDEATARLAETIETRTMTAHAQMPRVDRNQSNAKIAGAPFRIAEQMTAAVASATREALQLGHADEPLEDFVAQLVGNNSNGLQLA